MIQAEIDIILKRFGGNILCEICTELEKEDSPICKECSNYSQFREVGKVTVDKEDLEIWKGIIESARDEFGTEGYDIENELEAINKINEYLEVK